MRPKAPIAPRMSSHTSSSFVSQATPSRAAPTLSSRLARQAKRKRAQRGGIAFAFSTELGRVLGEDAAKFIAGKPVLSLLLALAGGVAVGISPRLRALLLTLLKY